MSKLSVVIVDDELLALDRLGVLLSRLRDVEIAGRADGCATAIPLVCSVRPDLLLLDIHLRDGDAFDILEALPADVTPLVAFTTAYPKYACRAFRVEALDYLLKPVEPDQLTGLVDRARSRRALLSSAERAAEMQRVVDQLREDNIAGGPPRWQTEIWIRYRGTDQIRVAVEDIDWISVQDDYACLHASGREHLLRISLNKLQQDLNPEKFVRIHRGIIVRADRVASVRRKHLGVREAVLEDGTCLPVGRVHAKRLPWRT